MAEEKMHVKTPSDCSDCSSRLSNISSPYPVPQAACHERMHMNVNEWVARPAPVRYTVDNSYGGQFEHVSYSPEPNVYLSANSDHTIVNMEQHPGYFQRLNIDQLHSHSGSGNSSRSNSEMLFSNSESEDLTLVKERWSKCGKENNDVSVMEENTSVLIQDENPQKDPDLNVDGRCYTRNTSHENIQELRGPELDMESKLESLSSEMTGIKMDINSKFESISSQIEGIKVHVNSISSNIERISADVNSKQLEPVSNLESKFRNLKMDINSRMDSISSDMEGMKVDMHSKLDSMCSQLTGVMDDKISWLKSMIDANSQKVTEIDSNLISAIEKVTSHSYELQTLLKAKKENPTIITDERNKSAVGGGDNNGSGMDANPFYDKEIILPVSVNGPSKRDQPGMIYHYEEMPVQLEETEGRGNIAVIQQLQEQNKQQQITIEALEKKIEDLKADQSSLTPGPIPVNGEQTKPVVSKENAKKKDIIFHLQQDKNETNKKIDDLEKKVSRLMTYCSLTTSDDIDQQPPQHTSDKVRRINITW